MALSELLNAPPSPPTQLVDNEPPSMPGGSFSNSAHINTPGSTNGHPYSAFMAPLPPCAAHKVNGVSLHAYRCSWLTKALTAERRQQMEQHTGATGFRYKTSVDCRYLADHIVRTRDSMGLSTYTLRTLMLCCSPARFVECVLQPLPRPRACNPSPVCRTQRI